METEIEREYHPNGRLRLETPYAGGVLHGLTKYWYSNGELGSEKPYVDGKRHGMAKYWNRNGDIDCFWLYNQGEHVATFNPRNQTQRWKLK
jgi:antitoxin component YwqK of YwqJK toxin-antitoxin module